MRIQTKLFLIAFAGFGGLVLNPANAQPQEAAGLRMEVDKHEVAVGDTITLTIEFRQYESGTSTASGEPSIPTPEHFQIQSQSSSTQVVMLNQQASMVQTTQYTLVATKPGEETLGPALLVYQDASMKKKELKSNDVTIKIDEKSGFSLFGRKKEASPPTPVQAPNNPSNPDELRGLKPLMPEAQSPWPYIIWPLVALLIAGFIWWQLRKPGASAPPPIPVGKEAQLRDAWKKLGKEELSAKEFCLGLSTLVRECVQYRYLFPAVNYTTEQILGEMAARKASDDEKVAIEKCLRTCDRVLHADGNLTGRDNLRALASALLPKVPRSN